MKKLISALTLGAMVAGAAFADVAVSANYRQRANLLSYNFEQNKNDASAKTMFLDSYSGNGSDNFTVALAGDIISFNMQLTDDQAQENYIRAKSLNAALHVGKVDLFGGFWSDGKVKGAYRNKNDVDAGNMEGMDFEFKKLGSSFANSPSFFVDNIVMGTDCAGENYALGATYNIPGTKKVKLQANGVYVFNGNSGDSNAGKNNQLKGHTVVGLVEARTASGTGEFVFKYGESKKTADKAMAFGAYLMPVTIDNLTTVIGGAGSVIDNTFTDWSADLRLYYKMGAVSFSSFNSISAMVDAKESSKLLDNTATKGIANSGAVAKGDHKGTPIARDMLLTNNLMVRWAVNKTFATYGFVADHIGFGESKGETVKGKDGKDAGALVELRAGIFGQFYAGSSSISIGCVYDSYDVTGTLKDDAENHLALPVIFRVKF